MHALPALPGTPQTCLMLIGVQQLVSDQQNGSACLGGCSLRERLAVDMQPGQVLVPCVMHILRCGLGTRTHTLCTHIHPDLCVACMECVCVSFHVSVCRAWSSADGLLRECMQQCINHTIQTSQQPRQQCLPQQCVQLAGVVASSGSAQASRVIVEAVWPCSACPERV